jgi:type IV pilus assembly protein PilB
VNHGRSRLRTARHERLAAEAEAQLGADADGHAANGSANGSLKASTNGSANGSLKANGSANGSANGVTNSAVEGNGDGNGHLNGPSGHDVHRGGGRLGELLVDARAVKRSLLMEALSQQVGTGQRLGRLLAEQGLVTERSLLEALATQSGLIVVDLDDQTQDDTVMTALPEQLVRELSAVPLRRENGHLIIAAAEPLDVVQLQRLADACRSRIAVVLAQPSDVRRLIEDRYRPLAEVDRHVQAFSATARRRSRTDQQVDAGVAADGPVVQVVQLLLTQALRDRASDVHIEPQDSLMRVRFRIDGALQQVATLPVDMGPALVSRIKILAGMNIVERRRSQDGQITVEIDGHSVDIRVATTATIWGEKCVLRLLDKSRAMLRLDDLGMPTRSHDAFSKLIHMPFGMMLCAGPTGSGKTTTLYASLMEVDEDSRNIMTIEDPVEYVVPSINQIQTNEGAGLTFASGLKSILRQDPDVILVGEIRDAETARIATQSALTGHLVMSTLHATDSVAALHRLLDMGIEAFLVASSVVAVVGQRLVRRICTSCKTQYKPTAEELAFFKEGGGDTAKSTFWQGAGCSECADTGYQGRIGVYELLTVSPEIRRLIVGWATQDELRRLAVSQGMRTLRQEGIDLVHQDVTTIAELIRGIYVA